MTEKKESTCSDLEDCWECNFNSPTGCTKPVKETTVIAEYGCDRCGNTELKDDTVIVYCPVCGLVRGHENVVTEEERQKWRVKRNGGK